jgi:uncharacterized protein YyaL (SSP411 family)
MPNRLATESSPYLAQHGDNPVDWFPWGSEALSLAKREDRPILLSIGYSACHWCHVMERESFEDEDTAAMMNRLFVNVKVDREERPDLDQIYQTTVQIMGRGGGWPLTVFLTPELRPFYAGTYFPPAPRHGMPSFQTVMTAVADAYRNKRDEIEESAAELTRVIGEVTAGTREEGDVPPDLLKNATRALSARIDETHGGFGTRPKFPNSLCLDVLLRAYHAEGDEVALGWATKALDAMRGGGVYDQIGWGFHRYSTDERWLVPHFEKMLYDNALLASTYLDAFLATREERHADTVREILAWAVREMTDEEGGFYATEDADSEGEEGRYFVWAPQELEEALGPELAEVASIRWGVAPGGNFEGGRSVLWANRAVDVVARQLGREPEVVAEQLERARKKLLAVRAERIAPFRDEKILAGWNGLMISAFARAGGALGDATLSKRATDALDFARRELFVNGELRRVYKDGAARIAAFLEDYGALADAAIDVHQATLEPEALSFAAELVEAALARFWDEERGAFHFAQPSDELVVRAHDVYDGATPSGTSTICHALLRLGTLMGEEPYERIAERALRDIAEPAAKTPFAFGHAICAMDRYLRGATMVVVVGEASDPEVARMLDAARSAYDPNLLLARVDPGADAQNSAAARMIGEGVERDSPTAFVCRDRTCGLPIADAEELARTLGGTRLLERPPIR